MIFRPFGDFIVTNKPPKQVIDYKWRDCPKDVSERNRLFLDICNTFKKGRGNIGVRYKDHTTEGDPVYLYIVVKDGEAYLVKGCRSDSYGGRVYKKKIKALDTGELERPTTTTYMPMKVYTEYDGQAPLVIRYVTKETEESKEIRGINFSYFCDEAGIAYAQQGG